MRACAADSCFTIQHIFFAEMSAEEAIEELEVSVHLEHLHELSRHCSMQLGALV